MPQVDFKMLAVSDLHFGNPKLSPAGLYENLQQYFYPETEHAHLILVAGDIYDQLLTVNSKAHKYASLFIGDLLRMSANTGCQIRILHGTYSHDRDQLSIFSTLAPPNARYAIIDEISCEELGDFRYNDEVVPDFKLRVGYIPDNLSYKRSDDVITHLRRNMKCYGWNQLDLLVGHGAFDHTLPGDIAHKPPCLYHIEQFRDWVQLIVMGHIHIHSHVANVYYCGSFDRMAHGEEEPKGYWSFQYNASNNQWFHKFVENKRAMPFITVEPHGADMSEATQDYIRQMHQLFPNRTGFVRALCTGPEMRALLQRVTAQHFPNVVFNSKTVGEKTEGIKVGEIALDMTDEVIPDRHNLSGLICQYLEENNLLDGISVDDIKSKTEKLLEGIRVKAR